MRILYSPLVSDIYMSGLVQGRPPAGANNVRYQFKGYFVCPTLADLRAIETSLDNELHYPMAILQGQDVQYDGLLQGTYFYVPEGRQNERADDDATWIIVNDAKSAWQKLT